MTATRFPRFAALRAGALGALGFGTLLAACDTRLPSGPEIDAMDVAAVENQAKRLHITAKDGKVTYLVDGREVSAEEARALSAGRIAQVEVLRSAGEGGTVRIQTGAAAEGQETRMHIVQGRALGTPGEARRVVVRTRAAGEDGPGALASGEFAGLIFIDGALAQPSEMRALNPDRIAGIEVIKGAAAAKLHADPKAAQGVIRITTRAGGTPRN